jgi:hypothetical protein
MKKIIRLTESDLTRIVKRVIRENKKVNLNETLKSDKVDIVVKKLNNFFIKMGLNKKTDFSHKVSSPYYMIITDKFWLEKLLISKKNQYDSLKNLGLDADQMISDLEKNINEITYGSIAISTDFNNKELTLGLISLITSMGYFISVINLKDGKTLNDKTQVENTLLNSDKISILIEPNYDDKVEFNSEYLYHTTDSKNLDKILKYGLIPKSKNTRSFYPERIYLSPNQERMSFIRNELVGDKGGDYINLRIKNFNELSLYKDLRFKDGFFTYDNIPQKYIEVI